VVGISAFSTQYPAVKLIAEHIKSERKSPFIVGGPLANYQPEMVLRTTASDVCVVGEGEISGLQILDHFHELEKVRGIVFKRNGIHTPPPRVTPFNLEELPFPNFSLFDMGKYLR
jgi:radical SAM superfamily enzyme YgiQ (UPF0313 family)